MVAPNDHPPEAPPSVGITVSVQELIDAVCPDCRKVLRKLLADKLHKAITEGKLDSQLGAKHD